MEKLVLQEIRNITLPRRIVATYDNRQVFCLQSTNVINLRPSGDQMSIKFLLAILNSNAANFFFRQRFPGNNHIPSNQLSQIPIPSAETNQRLAMVELVDRILTASHSPNAADTVGFEREIDEHVYRLYGLTPDEVRLVEESTASSDSRLEPAYESPPFA